MPHVDVPGPTSASVARVQSSSGLMTSLKIGRESANLHLGGEMLHLIMVLIKTTWSWHIPLWATITTSLFVPPPPPGGHAAGRVRDPADEALDRVPGLHRDDHVGQGCSRRGSCSPSRSSLGSGTWFPVLETAESCAISPVLVMSMS